MSLTGAAQSAKLTGSTSQLGLQGPLSVAQGWAPTEPRRQPAPERRRRPQNAAATLGRHRKSPSVVHSARSWVRSEAGDLARRAGALAGPGDGRSWAGDEAWRRWSSGAWGCSDRRLVGHGLELVGLLGAPGAQRCPQTNVTGAVATATSSPVTDRARARRQLPTAQEEASEGE
jgi:hypothetical protein